MILVVKVGTSSITDKDGNLEVSHIRRLVGEIARLKSSGHQIVLVTSGAIAAGRPALADSSTRSASQKSLNDYTSLQALATIGQNRLLSVYQKELDEFKLVSGQVLVTLDDFLVRKHYLRVRAVIQRLLELGVVPVVNENDSITDEEIRFGDNDRLAAMMSHLVRADLLVLLTDMEGLYTADPRFEENTSLIKEIEEIDRELELAAGGTGSESARGGMASKLAAARIASWSGISCVVASSFAENVLGDIVSGKQVGTQFKPRKNYLSARKLWIGFAAQSKGVLQVDEGAASALVQKNKSLLPVGVISAEGNFDRGDAVEVKDTQGELIAKGLVSISSAEFQNLSTPENNEAVLPEEFIHRDDMVVLTGL